MRLVTLLIAAKAMMKFQKRKLLLQARLKARVWRQVLHQDSLDALVRSKLVDGSGGEGWTGDANLTNGGEEDGKVSPKGERQGFQGVQRIPSQLLGRIQDAQQRMHDSRGMA